MLNYSTCTKENRQKAIELSKKIFKANMDQQFLLLFGESNLDHMFIATDDSHVVSMVNYYRSVVQIGAFQTKVASVGSVCTLENFRRQSIASHLMNLAEEKMIKEDVTIAIISGDGGLYQRFGSDMVGNMIGYKITRSSVQFESDLRIETYREAFLEDLIKLYEKEPIRYLRTVEEFRQLIQGQTYPDTFADYPFLLIFDDNVLVSYMIFSRPFGKRSLLTKEFGGSRKHIFTVLPQILRDLKKFNLTIVCDPTDELNDYLSHQQHQSTNLHASLKLIQPEKFFVDLIPYMKELLPENDFQSLSFHQLNDSFIIQYKNEQLSIPGIHDLNKLVFGPNKFILSKVKSNRFKGVLNRIFPIPFVWVNNLNYQ